MGGAAYALAVPLLDWALAPPLAGLASYGQFGFQAIYLAVFWALGGASMCVLRGWPFGCWLGLYGGLRGLAFAWEPELAAAGFASVAFAGQLVVDVPLVAAAWLVRRTQSRGG